LEASTASQSCIAIEIELRTGFLINASARKKRTASDALAACMAVGRPVDEATIPQHLDALP
jgi:hypothetical protein